tara:strand:+ start:1341 stop:1691 length:351 start_codon:yes stop_codon:yes gene_type:complete
MSPVETAFDVVNAECTIMFPDVDASNTATCVTVPQEAVAASNSIDAVFVAVSPVTEKVTALRVYPLPDTSVPVPASVGSDVNRPIYQVVGRVTASVVSVHFRTVVSNVFEKLIVNS